MFKKIVCNVALIIALLLAVFMFSSCVVPEAPDVPDNGLAEYKAAAQAELEAYAESKGEGNYTAENWAAIEGFVADVKAAVDAAADRAGVDVAVAAAKEEIDAVWRLGTFYSLQEAYDEGLLTYDDLRTLAYGNGLNNEDGFVPIPKTPGVLSTEIENAIKYNYMYYIQCKDEKHVQIEYYGGTYGDCVAVVIESCLTSISVVNWQESIGGINFIYSGDFQIIIWKPSI